MKLAAILLVILALTSCDGRSSFDKQAALAWSQNADTRQRQKAVSYSFQRSDGAWVSISTAKMTETKTGLMYSGGHILESDFFVYPGGQRAASIQEAIKICCDSEGTKYRSEQAGSSNGG